MTFNKADFAGLIPAAGKATRLGNLPFSKELYPFSIRSKSGIKKKVVSDFLINGMKHAGVINYHIVLRDQKLDIIQHFKSGAANNINISYHITEDERGVPFTLDQAYSFITDKTVFFGFPDILVKPLNSYTKLHEHFKKTKTDIVLGLYPVAEYLKYDMVECDNVDNIRNIIIKSKKGKDLSMAWINAVWGPAFSKFMHDVLASGKYNSNTDLHLGVIIQDAIDNGLQAAGLKFKDGLSIDIGTPEELSRVLKMFDKDPEWIEE